MPEVSDFYGISVEIRYNEHNPPHFHAKYGEYEAQFDFDGNIINGEFPPKKARMVAVWAEMRREDLEINWNLAKENKKPRSIEPLR